MVVLVNQLECPHLTHAPNRLLPEEGFVVNQDLMVFR